MHVPTVRALRLLYDMDYSPYLTGASLHDLVLDATGDKTEAEDSATGRQEQIMRSKHEQEGR